METYYDPADLAKFGEIGKDAPELAKKFFDYYAEVFKEGELTEREKALIALAVGARGPVPLLHRRVHGRLP
jgi:4-carboxymuconolactone decarboxylase